MKRKIDTDGCSWYAWIYHDGEGYKHNKEVEIPDEVYQEYLEYEKLHEMWQAQLHTWYDAATYPPKIENNSPTGLKTSPGGIL